MLTSIFQQKKWVLVGAAVAVFHPLNAVAANLVTLSVEASISGNAGSYSTMLPSVPASGSILFYEVVAQYAGTTATNLNTAKQPNGTSDSLVSLQTFTLTSSANTVFNSSTLQNNFNTGSGASAGATGANALTIRAIEQGFTENADTPLIIDSGQLTVGSSFTGITAANVSPITAPGSLRVAGSPVAITQTTETSGDALIGYAPLAIQTPEPVSLTLFALTFPALLVRRRQA